MALTVAHSSVEKSRYRKNWYPLQSFDSLKARYLLKYRRGVMLLGSLSGQGFSVFESTGSSITGTHVLQKRNWFRGALTHGRRDRVNVE